jgi:mannose-6-phosphate isomerase-like protein (cupin superfamily)
VVTGHDGEGKPCIIEDGEPSAVFSFPSMPGYEITELCAVDRIPVHFDEVELHAREWKLQTPLGGIRWRMVVRPPETPGGQDLSGLMSEVGAPVATSGGESQSKHGLHRTQSLDLLMILSGEVYLAVGENEVLLKPGDCIVQGGVEHAWHNRGSVPCVMCGFMIGAAE